MIIGIPKEIKEGEFRAAMTPAGVAALTRAGHSVRVQKGAGGPSGFPDEAYRRAGAALTPGAAGSWAAELVVKVKEPQPGEFRFFRPNQILFAFLHLAPNPILVKELLKSKGIAIAYETVESQEGRLPILKSMSEMAGRIAVLMGAYYQGNPQGGGGVLFSGARGAPPAHVVILGGGTVGENAARVAVGMGSRVTILERHPGRLKYLRKAFRSQASARAADAASIQEEALSADILIGALHIPGAKTPQLISRRLVRKMKPSSVIVDVAIDQGGSCETSRPTSHLNPTYQAEGVLHYCVPNMPGAYARTSTAALAHVTLPYVLSLAGRGVPGSLQKNPGFAKGVQCYQGHLTCPPVGEAQRLRTFDLAALIKTRVPK